VSERAWRVPQAVARRDVEGKRALLHIAENHEHLADQVEAVRKIKASVAL
jgi:hypothetical protein